jgi:hypothetical protein
MRPGRRVRNAAAVASGGIGDGSPGVAEALGSGRADRGFGADSPQAVNPVNSASSTAARLIAA